MQYCLGKESSKDFQTCEWGWLSLVLWQHLDDSQVQFALDHSQWVPCVSVKAILRAFFATKSFATGSSTYPCHMAWSQSQSQGTLYLRATVIPKGTEMPWMWCALVEADHSAFLSCILQGSWGSCSWHHIRAEYPGWDTWSALGRTPQVHEKVLSWYCFCLWLPHRKKDVGAST
jgi:hypothetical protein